MSNMRLSTVSCKNLCLTKRVPQADLRCIFHFCCGKLRSFAAHLAKPEFAYASNSMEKHLRALCDSRYETLHCIRTNVQEMVESQPAITVFSYFGYEGSSGKTSTVQPSLPAGQSAALLRKVERTPPTGRFSLCAWSAAELQQHGDECPFPTCCLKRA